MLVTMKTAYVVCALLCVTIRTLVLANNSAAEMLIPTLVQNDTKNTTTPLPASINVTPVSNARATTPTATTPISPTSTKPTITNTTTISTTNTTPNTASSTTASNTTASNTTTSNTTSNTTLDPITTTKYSTSVSPTPIITASNSTIMPATTPIPSSSSSSKDRHFDGLSFFGGIILATCLMAISVFAWKFYKQCNEGNYRTL